MKKSKLPIRVYARFKHDYENILISMQTSIDSGDFDLIEQTYQDILKKAGQELVEEDDETVS